MASGGGQSARIALYLPIIMEDKTIWVIRIPKMSEAAFAFFKERLDEYRPAIVLDAAKAEEVGDDSRPVAQ